MLGNNNFGINTEICFVDSPITGEASVSCPYVRGWLV